MSWKERLEKDEQGVAIGGVMGAFMAVGALLWMILKWVMAVGALLWMILKWVG